jgi:hypothetical protein
MLNSLCESRHWCNQIVAIAHNAKAFDLHFMLNRAILLKWRPEQIMNGEKIICMSFEHMKFVDSICFLPFPLRKLSGSFGLTVSKSWYPHYFNKMETLDYVRQIPKTSDYGVEERSIGERNEFLAWYEEQKSMVFNNRQMLESYCQDDFTVLRQAWWGFRGEFMRVGNIGLFQESVIIASACNKVLLKLFLKPYTIGLILTGGYTVKVICSKKTVMRLVYREQTDGCHIHHGRNGRQYRMLELPNLSVDAFFAETKTV